MLFRGAQAQLSLITEEVKKYNLVTSESCHLWHTVVIFKDNIDYNNDLPNGNPVGVLTQTMEPMVGITPTSWQFIRHKWTAA